MKLENWAKNYSGRSQHRSYTCVTRNPQKASNMESFATIVNGLQPLAIVAKHSILDVCENPGNVSESVTLGNIFRYLTGFNVP